MVPKDEDQGEFSSLCNPGKDRMKAAPVLNLHHKQHLVPPSHLHQRHHLIATATMDDLSKTETCFSCSRRRTISLPDGNSVVNSSRVRTARKISICHLPAISEHLLIPPVTRHSLRELDLDSLANNLQLKHDLMLEPAYKLKAKPPSPTSSQVYEAYWREWYKDFMQCLSCLRNQSSSKNSIKGNSINGDQGLLKVVGEEATLTPRLSLFMVEVKDIMLSMYPNSHIVCQDLVHATDLAFIRHQMRNGAFDVVEWVQLLAEAMQANCAPKRDGQIAALLDSLQGERFLDVAKLIMALLEGQKLDLANYNLAKLKSDSIQNMIHAERAAVHWTTKHLERTRVFLKKVGILRGIFEHLADSSSWIPPGFHLDNQRLSAMRETFHKQCHEEALKTLKALKKPACPLAQKAALNPNGQFWKTLVKRQINLLTKSHNTNPLSLKVQAMLRWHLMVHGPTYREILLNHHL